MLPSQKRVETEPARGVRMGKAENGRKRARTILSTVVRDMGRVALLGACIAGANAQTQQATLTDEGIIERVTVTGSRVRNAAAEASSPVVTIGAEAFALSGAPSPDGLLN